MSVTTLSKEVRRICGEPTRGRPSAECSEILKILRSSCAEKTNHTMKNRVCRPKLRPGRPPGAKPKTTKKPKAKPASATKPKTMKKPKAKTPSATKPKTMKKPKAMSASATKPKTMKKPKAKSAPADRRTIKQYTPGARSMSRKVAMPPLPKRNFPKKIVYCPDIKFTSEEIRFLRNPMADAKKKTSLRGRCNSMKNVKGRKCMVRLRTGSCVTKK